MLSTNRFIVHSPRGRTYRPSRSLDNLLLASTSSTEYRPANWNYTESAHIKSSTSIDPGSKTIKRVLGFHIIDMQPYPFGARELPLRSIRLTNNYESSSAREGVGRV